MSLGTDAAEDDSSNVTILRDSCRHCVSPREFNSRAGTIVQFTWHGDSNFFQVNFEVPISDLQPGVSFSDMFMQTLTVTNPVGQYYLGGDNTSAGSGTYIPWDISVQMNDFQRSTEVIISGAVWPVRRTAQAGSYGSNKCLDHSSILKPAAGVLRRFQSHRLRRCFS